MNRKNGKKIFTCLFLIMFISVIIPINSTADAPFQVFGNVYINDQLAGSGVEVKLVFGENTYYTENNTTNDNGEYLIYVPDEHDGQTGTFYVSFDSYNNIVTDPETINVDKQYAIQGYLFSQNLEVNILNPNNPPEKPINPLPENNSEEINLNPVLSVLVSDSNGNDMDVYFYNASDDTLLGSDLGVDNNTRAEIQITGLSYETVYLWYAVANDSEYEVKSDIYNFKTESEDNTPPEITIRRPEAGGLYILDYKLFSGILNQTIIIGKIKIELDVVDNKSDVALVELYIKKTEEQKVKSFTSKPYSYLWKSVGFGEHILTVKAYDSQGNMAEKSMTVKKFF